MIQIELGECGMACLVLAIQKLGSSADLAELRRKHGSINRGMTLRELRDVAATMGMSGRAVRCEPNELAALRSPSILHWGFNHYVLLDSVSKTSIVINDPVSGRARISMAEVGRMFTGVALELSRAPDFVKRKERSPLSVFSWFQWTPQLASPLGQLLMLSVLLQGYIIASPLYLQTVVDQVAQKGDANLLIVLAIGFGAACVFNAVANLLRDVVATRLTMLLSWEMSVRLFRHLVRLPLQWFERRRLADIISRIECIAPIRDLVSGGIASVLIDGLLAFVTVGMMFYVSATLAGVAVIGVAVFIALRLAAMPLSLRLGGEALTSRIAEQGKRIEVVRTIQMVRAAGAEDSCSSRWENSYARLLAADQRSTLVHSTFNSLHLLCDGLIRVVLIYVGAKAVLEASLTIGMLYAFLAYQSQFAGKVASVFDQVVAFKMTDLYSYRLADIALTKKDQLCEIQPTHQADGTLQVSNVAFAYAANGPWVLRDINLAVKKGEFIVIVGTSGAGKSTLMKVLCGLYPVSKGEIMFGGADTCNLSAQSVRASLGIVLQDDELIAGTISENVALFEDGADQAAIWHALELAGLAEDVRRMPLQLHAQVGDTSTGISSGQKQRILLARALFRKPTVLLLDEATSHLDAVRESQINMTIKSLHITRIVVTHRQDTIACADRVFRLVNGKIYEDLNSLPVVKASHDVDVDLA